MPRTPQDCAFLSLGKRMLWEVGVWQTLDVSECTLFLCDLKKFGFAWVIKCADPPKGCWCIIGRAKICTQLPVQLLLDLFLCYVNKREASQREKQRARNLWEKASCCTVYEAGGNCAFLIKFIAFWAIRVYSWLLTHALGCTGLCVFPSFSSVTSEGPCTKEVCEHL